MRPTMRPRVLRKSATPDFDLLASYQFTNHSKISASQNSLFMVNRRGTPALHVLKNNHLEVGSGISTLKEIFRICVFLIFTNL